MTEDLVHVSILFNIIGCHTMCPRTYVFGYRTFISFTVEVALWPGVHDTQMRLVTIRSQSLMSAIFLLTY